MEKHHIFSEVLLCAVCVYLFTAAFSLSLLWNLIIFFIFVFSCHILQSELSTDCSLVILTHVASCALTH